MAGARSLSPCRVYRRRRYGRANRSEPWVSGRATVPAIQQLRSRAEQYRQVELERAGKLLARGEEPAKVLEMLANGLTNKFLHHPLTALNRSSGAEREALAEALGKLYPDQEET